MRNEIERKQLLEKVASLYPQGCTTAKDMLQTFQEAGIRDIGLTRVSLLTRFRGKNDIIVGYLATEYVDNEGRVSYDPFEGNMILNHPVMEVIQKVSGEITKLGRIDLHNHPNSGLIPGKINPLDIPRLGMRIYKRSRHFFISAQTAGLASKGVEVILPFNIEDFEIRSLQEVVEGLKEKLIARRWHGVHVLREQIEMTKLLRS